MKVSVVFYIVQELRQESDDDSDKIRLTNLANTKQKFLSQKLAEFLACDVSYTLRRVLPAEAAKMYLAYDQGKFVQKMNFAFSAQFAINFICEVLLMQQHNHNCCYKIGIETYLHLFHIKM